MLYGFYHGKSPFCTTIWGICFFWFSNHLKQIKVFIANYGANVKKGMTPVDFSGNKSFAFVWLLRNFREVSSIRTWESGSVWHFLGKKQSQGDEDAPKEVFYSRAEWFFTINLWRKVKGFMLMFTFFPKTWVRWIPFLLMMCCNWIELTHVCALVW